MKRIIIVLMLAALALSAFTGCGAIDQMGQEFESGLDRTASEVQSGLERAGEQIESGAREAESAVDEAIDKSSKSGKSSSSKSKSSSSKSESASSKTYTMDDIAKLKNTDNFAKNTLEHIFDGTINKKGEATGYHYDPVTDSKGSIIKGTESKPDSHGVFTAKVKVGGVKKNGFSSFYPSDWTPQQVVDAINEAYEDALSDKSNPHGDLWIGYSGDLEIDMYLNNKKQITTAYPIYEED